MTPGMLRLVALSGVAVAGFAAASAFAAAAIHPWLARRVRHLPPALRARALLAWAATPASLVIALLGLTLWPSVGAVLGLAVDHCPDHAGHIHICLHHLPMRGPAAAGAIAISMLGMASAAAIIAAVRARWAAKRILALRSFEIAPNVGGVESAHPLAVTVGWLRPRVLLSTALLDRLSPPQLEVVVAHERAHAVRRDALAMTSARLLALAHLPPVRRRVLAELALAQEQACDEIAARACRDRVLVAETIIAAERAAAAAPMALSAAGFGGSEVAERVQSLLDGPRRAPARRGLTRLLLLACAAAAVALAPHVHHWTESLLDFLPH
jgi:Zn-dependent protease with chaperone function